MVVGAVVAAALFSLAGTGNPLKPEQAQAAGLIAPPSVCVDRPANGGPRAMRLASRSMLCFVNYARKRARLRAYRNHGKLNWSAKRKAGDILRCQFSHTACGRSFDHWIRRSGYIGKRSWAAGENIAWGSGALGRVRPIFVAWMQSRGHRQAILSRMYRHVGVGVTRGRYRSSVAARSWVLHFGSN